MRKTLFLVMYLFLAYERPCGYVPVLELRTCFGHAEDLADGPFLAVQGEADPPQGVEPGALPL